MFFYHVVNGLWLLFVRGIFLRVGAGCVNFRPCAQIVKVMSEMITIINDHDYYSTMIMIMRTNCKSDGWDDYVLNGA